MSADQSVSIEWIAQDQETLAHTSVLRVDGREVQSPLQATTSPHHSLTRGEFEKKLRGIRESYSPLIIAGETLKMMTLEKVGYDTSITDDLLRRLKEKMISNRINLVFPRIPYAYKDLNGNRVPPPVIDELRASALVGVQLDADASLVIPPIPTGIQRRKDFLKIFERTKVELQTFRSKKEMIGFVATTENLELARDMVVDYAKNGCRFFAVDFSGASNQPSLMRTVVRAIRESLKIRKKPRETDEKYYLHVFNAATSKKSVLDVSPLSDVIIHPYGVDSTSGVMWGGGSVDDPGKLRYYLTDDYGAYRKAAILDHGTSCRCPVCKEYSLRELYSGSVSTVLDRLQKHRLHSYAGEYKRISERIGEMEPAKGYLPYLYTKSRAEGEIKRIVEDVKEIRAGL